MTDFEAWLADEFARRGEFTALILLVREDDGELSPICSSYVNVIGTDIDWGEMTTLLSGSGVRWDGVVFFAVTDEDGGALPAVAARLELRALETTVADDPSHLATGRLFDTRGRGMRLRRLTAAGHA